MEKAKLEAQKQWNTDPCGASTAGGLKEGSLEFFEAVKQFRYCHYAPWMVTVIGFDRFCGKKVLEIGPGLGTDLLQFAQNGAKTYAVDLAQGHLELTQKNFGLHGCVAPCALGDAEALPFENEVFDCVYGFGVLHHTPDIEIAIAEIHRVLKTGGRAIIGLYHRDSAYYWVSTIFFRGVVLLGLLKRGYRNLMSEIEFRSADSDAMPLVKVYGRNEVKRLFGGFRMSKIQAWHFEYNHLFPVRRLSRLFARWVGQEGFARCIGTSSARGERIERMERFFGWYLVIEAEK